MALKLIKTKNAAFAMDEVQDDVREKMGILFGRAIHLYAKRVPTAANPKGVMQYSIFQTKLCKFAGRTTSLKTAR